MHEHALGAGAALARRQIAADRDLVHRLAQRAVVEHDARRSCRPSRARRAARAIERALRGSAPTAQLPVKHSPRSSCAHHRRADAAVADDDVEHAGRQLRGVRGLGVALPAQRRDVARLDDDRVAREQRRHDVRVTEMSGKLNGPITPTTPSGW
jgi:hypothetical protein